MLRSDIINALIEKHSYKSYLEIGYGGGGTFHLIKMPIEKKIGVDGGNGTPSSDEFVVRMTSDEYFRKNNEVDKLMFDIIFIDGSHLSEDVENDLKNALLCLNPAGSIVMHDCSPPNQYYQERTQSPHVPGWTGDTWKAFVKARALRPDIKMCVVDTDYGCGIVRYGTQELLKINVETDLTYENLEKNRTLWLNLIETGEFLEEMKV
tara:strand:- start:440 stop:1060 length:621 start_codon:yes stop_codon:yes gene_type:complete